MDVSGKYVGEFTKEQMEELERVYRECPKPNSIRLQQLIQEAPVLANIELKQIKLWLQDQRFREKQKKESTKLVSLNANLTALNRRLFEENERLARHTSQLILDNHMLRQQIRNLPAGPDPGSQHSLLNQAMRHWTKEERVNEVSLANNLPNTCSQNKPYSPSTIRFNLRLECHSE